MHQQRAQQLFAEVHRLHSMGKNNTQIADILQLRRATVVDWLKQSDYHERRGWRLGRVRKPKDPCVAERIRKLKKRSNEHCYLVGSPYVQMDYAKRYPREEQPSLWYIDQVVREADLQTRKPKEGKHRGGSVYLLYPVTSMRRLGLIQESADFIGKKYLDGCSRPVTIFSSCYYRPFKMYQIYRTEAEKASFAIDILARQWQEFPTPHVLRMDNGAAFRGTATYERCLGSFLVFLLNLGITPLFGSPSRPWTNGAVEGHNRVFTEKVWQKNRFRSFEEVDRENDRFNAEGREFYEFRYHTLATRFEARRLKPTAKIKIDTLRTRRNKRIAFVRFVEPAAEEPRAHVLIMNKRVFLPEAYLHQFVFATWDLETEELSIVSEYQGTCTPILRCTFKIHD
jgi:hypothetical protein